MDPFFGRKRPLAPSLPSSSSRLPPPTGGPMVPSDGRHPLVHQERHELDLLSRFERKYENQEEEDMLELRLGVGPRRKTGEGLQDLHAPPAASDGDGSGTARYLRKGCCNGLCSNCDGKKCDDVLVARSSSDGSGGGSVRSVASPPVGLLKLYNEKRFDFGGGGGNSNATQLVEQDADNSNLRGEVRAAPKVMNNPKRKLDQRGDISPQPIRLATQKVNELPDNTAKKDPRSIWAAYKLQVDLFPSTPVVLKKDDSKEKKDDPKDTITSSCTNDAESSTVPPDIQVSDDEKSDDTLDIIV